MTKKGISAGILGIILMIGVLGIAIWSTYQLSVGSIYESGITQTSKQDVAQFKLEAAKRFLQDDLIFASRQAALDIAVRGGTVAPATFYYCFRNEIVPPSPEEVLFALSDTAENYLNAYVKTSQEEGKLLEMNVEVPEYSCVGEYDPGYGNCNGKDSTNCEQFWTTATGGGNIKVTDPVSVADTDKLVALNDLNRFFWLYYNLYEDTQDRTVTNIITDVLDGRCRNDKITEGDMLKLVEVALDQVCTHYESLFDGYVSCEYEVECFNGEGNRQACLNVACVREPFAGDLCWKGEGLETETLNKIFTQAENPSKPSSIELQGTQEVLHSEGSLRFRFELTDSKYLLPSSKGLQKPLVWNLWGALELYYPDTCYVVEIVGGGGAAGNGGWGGPSI